MQNECGAADTWQHIADIRFPIGAQQSDGIAGIGRQAQQSIESCGLDAGGTFAFPS